MGHSDTTGCGISCSSQLVQQTRCSPRSSSTSPRTQPVFLHGCISNRLGSQLAASSTHRTVVKPRIISAHQLAGARSHHCIRLTLLQWGTQWRNQTVRVYCDNSMAVAYIHKQGGTHSIFLFNKTLELFHLLDQFVILLIPTHLPGARNVTADALSGINSPSPTEWRIPQETLSNLFSVLGTPLVDMFAMAENKVTLVFVSPYPGNRAWDLDALSI